MVSMQVLVSLLQNLKPIVKIKVHLFVPTQVEIKQQVLWGESVMMSINTLV